MPRQYQLINEINAQSRLWTAQIFIEDKYQRRDDQATTQLSQSPSKYQKLLLIDPMVNEFFFITNISIYMHKLKFLSENTNKFIPSNRKKKFKLLSSQATFHSSKIR